MRSINLLKIAAEAELVRLRAWMQRHARRGVDGAVAAVFGVAVLASGSRGLAGATAEVPTNTCDAHPTRHQPADNGGVQPVGRAFPRRAARSGRRRRFGSRRWKQRADLSLSR